LLQDLIKTEILPPKMYFAPPNLKNWVQSGSHRETNILAIFFHEIKYDTGRWQLVNKTWWTKTSSWSWWLSCFSFNTVLISCIISCTRLKPP